MGARSTWRSQDDCGGVAAVPAALSEVPQPGRVHLRPRLGRRLRARRGAVLSQAGLRVAVLAGDGAKAPGPPDVDRGGPRPALVGAPERFASGSAPRRLGINFPARGRVAISRAARPAAAPEPAIPLAQRRLRDASRIFSAPFLRAAARPFAASAGTRRPAWRSSASRARDLTEEHWDAFFAFYMDTGSRKWGRPYLNRRFFSLLGERMADKVLLVMAQREGRWIAGALNLIGADCLYGRNWGCLEDVPFLHFELCYYQAIE